MKDPINKNQSVVLWPFLAWLVWMVLGVIYLRPFIVDNDYSEGTIVFLIILLIIIRIAVCISTLNLTKRHGLSQNVWSLIAFIAGANQLLFLNIALWMHPPNYKNR